MPGTPDVPKIANHKKAVTNGVDEVVGGLNITAFLCGVEPNVVKIDFDTRGNPVRHSTGARAQFRKKPRPAALLDFLSELPHGFLGHNPALATRKGRASIVKRKQQLGPLPLALLP
jgi:hypothetical protein